MPYLLDTNVFIEGNNRFYGIDFCPAYWDWIEREHKKNNVFSVQAVKDELTKRNDDVWDRLKSFSKSLFLPADQHSTQANKKVSEWVMGKTQYEQSARNLFFDSADQHLVAYALGHQGFVVVTQEVSAPMATRNIKIPDVCDGVGCKHTKLFDMLRTEKAKFELK